MRKKYFGNKEAQILPKKQVSYIVDVLNNYEINYQDKTYRYLENNSFNYLKHNRHMVTLTTFGKKYLMFFTKISHNKVCIFINKRDGMFLSVNINAPDSLYNNTLIDGQFLKDYESDFKHLSLQHIKKIEEHIKSKNI